MVPACKIKLISAIHKPRTSEEFYENLITNMSYLILIFTKFGLVGHLPRLENWPVSNKQLY